ncbi:thermonuclease family protein [Schumannella sp. 10F1B-5-1]|uniref:thermonuclease family protein n=1 Tax=Schumannella sp. 10F1B-5-1 TaxID=2590780 RepID=UPI001132626E|nr:thermonuclease family protein [Schumannella sp. 10F1B-5-1]TPW72349.1 hypothetical protein FJ658_08770 [Schumannella sp. 10F1B-5-1]
MSAASAMIEMEVRMTRRHRRMIVLVAAVALVVIGVLTGALKLDDLVSVLGTGTSSGSDAGAGAGPSRTPSAPPTTPSGPAVGSDTAMPASAEAATIVRVVDGDTVVVRRAGRTDDETVRLAGIDTPETVKPNSPVECWGPEASDRAHALLPVGTAVRLEPDPTQGDADRYGRLLRYLWVPAADAPAAGSATSGTLINLQLVDEGAAEAYRDRHARWQQFQDAEARARASGAGLWGAC